jgi:hypothetical protein
MMNPAPVAVVGASSVAQRVQRLQRLRAPRKRVDLDAVRTWIPAIRAASLPPTAWCVGPRSSSATSLPPRKGIEPRSTAPVRTDIALPEPGEGLTSARI